MKIESHKNIMNIKRIIILLINFVVVFISVLDSRGDYQELFSIEILYNYYFIEKTIGWLVLTNLAIFIMFKLVKLMIRR